MKIIKTETKLQVTSEFNNMWIKEAKKLGGKWNSSNGSWDIDLENEELVMDALLQIYGYNPSRPSVDVTIEINADDFWDGGSELKLGNMILAERRGRDYAVSLRNNVIVVSGDFSESGGSRNNPSIGDCTDVKLRVKLPETLLANIDDNQYTVIQSRSKREKLKARKVELLAELQRIEDELTALGVNRKD